MSEEVRNGAPRRRDDIIRGRLLDLLVGVLLGVMATGLTSLWLVNGRLATVQEQVTGLRRDVDRLQAKLP